MRVRHGRTNLELHEIRPGTGPGVLLLHELHGCAADWRAQPLAWPGPVYALDFSGHGESEVLSGGAYSCEILLGDADCALAECSATAVAGSGLGAYVALLLSGARPQAVRATLLMAGRGLAGGGDFPRFDRVWPAVDDDVSTSNNGRDPFLSYFDNDVRPADYAIAFASRAQSLILMQNDAEQPPWWKAVAGVAGTVIAADGIERAYAALARLATDA
jgi:pimeloyl-ACP methyl ester carboxylesterase